MNLHNVLLAILSSALILMFALGIYKKKINSKRIYLIIFMILSINAASQIFEVGFNYQSISILIAVLAYFLLIFEKKRIK